MKKNISKILALPLFVTSLVSLPSCSKGQIKTYQPLGNVTALGVGGSSSKETPNSKYPFITTQSKLRITENINLYYQVGGTEIRQFDIGIENPENYRLLNLVETDDFVEVVIGSKQGLDGFEFDEWYICSPRNGSYMISNSRFDFHRYIIEKSTLRVAELIGEYDEYFPDASTVSLENVLYSVIDNPEVYAEALLIKYYFGEDGLVMESKALEKEMNPNHTHLFKDDTGNLYIQNLGSIYRFNEDLEIVDAFEQENVLHAHNSGASKYYLSPTNHLYSDQGKSVWNEAATLGFEETDENGETYDVREFFYWQPTYAHVVPNKHDSEYGPCSIDTSCRLYEDDEAIYYNYGKMENRLLDLTGSFKYAKYYKDTLKQPYINSFDIDELGAVLGSDVYYIKDNEVKVFDVINETHTTLCDISGLNLFEITSLYLGDDSKICLEGLDGSLNTFNGVIENGQFSYSLTPSSTFVTTLIPLN